MSEFSAITLLEMAIKGGRDSTLAELAFKALVESSMPCVDALKQCLSTVETSILDWERFAESLAKQHEFDALELLIRHPSADVRMAVARLFARHGTRKHLSMLQEAIAEEHDQYTRQRMMASLAELEKKGDIASQPVSLAPITPSERLRMRLIGQGALTWRDVPALVELLSHPVETVRAMARARLPEMGRAAIIALTNALDQRTNEDTRIPLWKSLFQLDEQLALRRVRTTVERGWTPPSNVVDALVGIGGQEAAELIVMALANEAPERRHRYRGTLRKLGQLALAPLSRRYRDDARIRGQEAELLAEIGRELVVDQLLNGLRDSDSGAVRADCAKGLIRCGEAAVTPLIAAYLRSDVDARQRMLHILACMRDPRAAELIRRAAASSVEEQETAVEVLSQLPRSEESTRIVLEAAKSERWQIRRSAAKALPHWHVDIALEVLTTLATDESSHVRESAFEGIARLALTGDDEAPVEVTRALIRMLSGSPEVVRWTISVLKRIGEIETIRQSIRELGPQSLHAREVLDQILEARARELETRARERVPTLCVSPKQGVAYCLRDERQPITDRVHFSVTAPGIVRAGTPFLLDVWAHLDSERRVVLARAREELRSRNIALRSIGPTPVQRDSSLGVRVSVPSFGFMEEDKLYWAGDISNSSFLILVPAEAKQDVHMGKVELFLGPLKIARLHFNVLVGDFSSEAEDRTLFEERTKTAFASYASEDRDAVLARIQGMLKLLPELDVFLDVIALRSGQEWACRIEDEIVARDTFYLFWSRFARQSEWVDREWHIALERKGLDCIDPVPLEPPTAAPPPPELSCLHFNDWTLAVGST